MTKISLEELNSLRQAFDLYDTKQNGAIDIHQLTEIVKNLGISDIQDSQIQKMIEENDKNGDQKIDFDEFVSLMTNIINPSNKRRSMSRHELDEMRLCFEKFDKNKDGKISKQELKDVMIGLGEKLTEEEIEDMMKDADTNKDGHIDFEEFKQLIPF
ncbi:unnamed protein product [Rhizopus stolonifer]